MDGHIISFDMKMTYEQYFMNKIEAIHPGTDFSRLSLLPDDISHDILREILETGCLSQNEANLRLARKALNQVPSEWLYEHLPRVVPLYLFKEREWQEWEFRRMAEMLQNRFPDSFTWLVTYARKLDNPEVNEAICDYIEQ